MEILITEEQLKKLIGGKITINNVEIFPNLDNTDENKKIGYQLLINECKKYKTPEDLLRSGGFSDFALDLSAFGFTEDSIKTLSPKNITIKWKTDLDNVIYEVEKSGLSPIEWSKKINLSEPVDVSFNGKKFYLEDGHHRYFAAKTLKKKLNVNLTINANPIVPLSKDDDYDQFHINFFNKHKGTINEQSRQDYLKWKRKNVTLRGVKELGKENNGGSLLGDGLYTAFLSNKRMAKEYGEVYYVVNAIPKKPKILSNLNEAEIFIQSVINKWCKERGLDYSRREFEKETNVRDEVLKLGYDGIVVRGREMVNYTPPDNVKYFENEQQLEMYFEDNYINF